MSFGRAARQQRHERSRWRHRWRHSLRARLITVFLLLALAMAAVFVGGTQRALSTGWRDTARPLVTDYMDRMVAEIGSPPDIAKAKAIVDRLPISISISGPTVNWNSRPENTRRERGGFGPSGSDWFNRETADGHHIAFGLAPVSWRHGPNGIGIATVSLVLLLVLLAYRYVRRLLRPLDDIRAGAERFGSGRFDQPIPLRRRDELGDLAQRINTMAHDIEGMLDAKRTLLLALSHELRSPLTRARLNAELLSSGGDSTPERDALMKDLNEMRDLISDLLESERLMSPHAALLRESLDAGALLREVLRDMPAANKAGAIVPTIAADLPMIALDRTRVRLLMRNLIDNALRYGAEATSPPSVTLKMSEPSSPMTSGTTSVSTSTPRLSFIVRDYGPGVEDSKLDQLTEPFYRTDSARQRATGGVGLGLYLCRLIAQAHGGSLRVTNALPGLRIEVTLN